jgi:hypothetical protein
MTSDRLSGFVHVKGDLELFLSDGGRWTLRGSADGEVYTAGDRLIWLFPLLERPYTDVEHAIPLISTADSPLPKMVRVALTSWSSYWARLAVGWLDAGFPAVHCVDALAALMDTPTAPQALRHSARRLWKRETKRSN